MGLNGAWSGQSRHQHANRGAEFQQFILFRNCERQRRRHVRIPFGPSRRLLASRIRRRRRAHSRGDGERRRSRPGSSIRLNTQSSANRSAGSTVSLQQLTHKVPRQAQKAYDKGRQAAHKGDQHAAEGFFRQAVEADPEFVDAHNELGASEVALGELPEAAEQFQKAIELVPEHRLALPNLSVVLAKLKRFHEAGEVARRALVVLPGEPRMHYILALSLLAENKQTPEVLNNLRRAAPDIPKAHIVAAEVFANTGRPDEAVLELEEYLRVQPADDKERPKVEARLAELRH